MVPIFKAKEMSAVRNYCGVKLMSLGLWERVIQCKIRDASKISRNQFGFILGRCRAQPIFLLRRSGEICKERKNDLYVVFINLER